MSLTEVLTLIGGIGLFLYGMTLMSTGIRQACGAKLKSLLELATRDSRRALLVGTGLTVLVQSSSATGAMVISFVDSGLMRLEQAAGVLLGANIGTTVTAQITAFEMSKAAPALLFAGAIMALFFKKELIRAIGSFLLGFGMLFQGIAFMKQAISPLAASESFTNLIGALSSPLLLILAGIIVTAILQSSSSSTVIFQAFAVEGLIGFSSAIYLLIGAAVGAVAPNFLAALTTERNGKRTALINLLFNLYRMVLILSLIKLFPVILDWIQALSPGDTARQVANAHTLFAAFSAVTALPFDKLLVKISQKILPFREDEIRRKNDFRLQYLVNPSLVAPGIALAQAKKEVSRMGHIALENLETAVDCFFDPSPAKERNVGEQEAVMDFLDKAVIEKMAELRSHDMSSEDMSMVYHLTLTVSDTERLSDYAENIAEHAVRLQQSGAVISPEGLADLRSMAECALNSVRLAIRIFDEDAFELLDKAEELEQLVDDKQEEIMNAHVNRLMHKTCEPLAGVIFTDFATEMERCSDHALNIAYALSHKTEHKDASDVLLSVRNENL